MVRTLIRFVVSWLMNITFGITPELARQQRERITSLEEQLHIAKRARDNAHHDLAGERVKHEALKNAFEKEGKALIAAAKNAARWEAKAKRYQLALVNVRVARSHFEASSVARNALEGST